MKGGARKIRSSILSVSEGSSWRIGIKASRRDDAVDKRENRRAAGREKKVYRGTERKEDAREYSRRESRRCRAEKK